MEGASGYYEGRKVNVYWHIIDDFLKSPRKSKADEGVPKNSRLAYPKELYSPHCSSLDACQLLPLTITHRPPVPLGF